MAKRHKDVEFEVVPQHGGRPAGSPFRTFDEAAGMAVAIAASTGGRVHIDVLVHSRAGARAYGGDDAVEQYLDDPDASVFERIVVEADSEGRVR